jgi:hypothetical protein
MSAILRAPRALRQGQRRAGQRAAVEDAICNTNALRWICVQEAFIVTARDMTEAEKKTFHSKAQ